MYQSGNANRIRGPVVALSREATYAMIAAAGSKVTVLTEKDDTGRSEHFLPARITGGAEAGEIVTGNVTGLNEGVLDVQRAA